jgi:hypothetical protein
VAVLQKFDVHTKNGHTSHEKTAYLTKCHSTVQVQRTEYNVQQIEYKIQNTEQLTKHRKTTAYTETTKHENKEKATAGN